MGLIKAIGGAVGGVMGDQWKEYFYCDSMPVDVLVRKGQKKTSSAKALLLRLRTDNAWQS